MDDSNLWPQSLKNTQTPQHHKHHNIWWIGSSRYSITSTVNQLAKLNHWNAVLVFNPTLTFANQEPKRASSNSPTSLLYIVNKSCTNRKPNRPKLEFFWLIKPLCYLKNDHHHHHHHHHHHLFIRSVERTHHLFTKSLMCSTFEYWFMYCICVTTLSHVEVCAPGFVSNGGWQLNVS